MGMNQDAQYIINAALKAAMPDTAVKKALTSFDAKNGKVILISIGKAAWQMAMSACDTLGDKITDGVVITKYGHSKGELPNITVCEAGHPVPDDNSFKATEFAINKASNLNENDTVLFLISGGGSALFEKPLIPADELTDITSQLLKCGANIIEMNTIRKRLSAVKGGKFAQICSPAKVFSVILSDIIGDPLDMIASGPACPDSSTSKQAVYIAQKYNLKLSEKAEALLNLETPKELNNIETHITGSVSQLCKAAKTAAAELGYSPVILTDRLTCEAKEAGKYMASVAKYNQMHEQPLAFIAGGETVVHVHGKGLGGRNQELALSAATGISGLKDTVLFSIGSDGTDGPTDAAGGYVDGGTAKRLESLGIDIHNVLNDNDSYHALEACDGLIKTGPTGTNVNDLTVLLIK